jgi:hypothetical protein
MYKLRPSGVVVVVTSTKHRHTFGGVKRLTRF